jgi:hypothetical protein
MWHATFSHNGQTVLKKVAAVQLSTVLTARSKRSVLVCAVFESCTLLHAVQPFYYAHTTVQNGPLRSYSWYLVAKRSVQNGPFKVCAALNGVGVY